MKNYKIKCQCCADYLEIYVGEGQVIFDITVTKWRFWGRLKYALWILWPRKEYGGSTIWISPCRWRNLIKKLNKS